jgi:hypothetical protein
MYVTKFAAILGMRVDCDQWVRLGFGLGGPFVT